MLPTQIGQRESQLEKSIKSYLSSGSPGEIRTLVSGSRAQEVQDSFVISAVDKTIADFWEYLKVEERLSKKVSKDYKNVAKRFLKLSVGNVSRQAVREFLKLYVDKAPRTYNNIIDALKAFIGRYLQRDDLLNGLKHTYVPECLEQSLPTREQLQKGFEALDTDKERAIYLFLATTGLRRSEALNLSKDDVDFEMRCVKAKHDTRTKRAGVTFYNEECEHYLRKYLASRTDDNSKLFRIGYREFVRIWRNASQAADCRIRPQVMRKWHSTALGELMVPDRFV
ncbi:MAG: tyrosine-type recombinase/integrase, partial [Candidatus Bathyarchaeia archaeon]